MVRAMCGVQLKDRKRCIYLMFMLAFVVTMDLLAMASGVHWYSHVLRREVDHILRRAFDFDVEGQRKKGRPKRTWKSRLRKKV